MSVASASASSCVAVGPSSAQQSQAKSADAVMTPPQRVEIPDEEAVPALEAAPKAGPSVTVVLPRGLSAASEPASLRGALLQPSPYSRGLSLAQFTVEAFLVDEIGSALASSSSAKKPSSAFMQDFTAVAPAVASAPVAAVASSPVAAAVTSWADGDLLFGDINESDLEIM